MKHRTSIEFPADLWKQLSSTIPERKKSTFIIEAIKDKLRKESKKVLILCGGEGTMMRPLTLSTPKPMLPMGYKPMLEHTISYFKDQGLDSFVLAIGYLGEQIIKYFGDGSAFGVNIEYSPEHKALGTAGAIKNAEKFMNSTFVMMFGDTIFRDLSISEVLQFHREKKSLATLVTTKVGNVKRFGVVESDKEGKVTGFLEKPKYSNAGWINAGMYVFEPQIFDYMKPGDKTSMESDVFPRLVEEGKLFAYKYGGYWADIGMPEDYEKAVKDFFAKGR